MESFFTHHWEVVLTIINGLVFVIVMLGTALVRVKFQHIGEDQRRQDARLGELEDDVSRLKGEQISTKQDLKNLSKNLDHYFKEIKEELAKHEARNDQGMQELKTLLKSHV